MAIVYRTDGAWGSGKGSNLAPAEADNNFYDLDGRLTYIEDNPVLPIEPISITITGYNFYMGLSNGETLGPVVQTRWGPVQVAAVISQGKICEVRAVVVPSSHTRSVAINNRAVPILNDVALASQSAAFQTVSGATVTSEGYRSSLQAILNDAK